MSYAGAKVNRRAQAAVALRGKQILAALAHGPAPLAEALARAGITLTTRRARAAYGVAAAALRASGLVCYTEGKSASDRVWRLVSPDEPKAQEEHQLADLDAVVRITTERRQTYGGTWRTEVSAVATLGPSWPATTPPPPRWSTAFVDAQVKHGALDGAIPAALSRMRAVLSTLRADTTRNPNTEVPVTDQDTISDLLAYCAGVSGGAKDSSVHSWLKARKLTRIRAEELLEQLVHEKPIAGGEVVVRYLPADPSTRPAPLPVSDAPAVVEEPPAEEAAEEPTLIGCVEEPPVCAWCEQRKADPERGALEDQLDQARAHAARCEAERDALAYRAERLTAEVEGHKNDFARIAYLLWLPKNFSADDVFHRAGEYARIARNQAPTLDAATIGEYLLDLPEGRWQVIAEARAAIAEGKALQAAGERKIAEGRAYLEQLLGTPAGAPAPAPAPELVPDPIPLGPTPPPPPPPAPEAVISTWEGDTGEAPGTMRDRVLRAFLSQPQREMRAGDLAAELNVDRHAVTGPLSTLTADGKLERVKHGVYRLARRLARRAA